MIKHKQLIHTKEEPRKRVTNVNKIENKIEVKSVE